MTDVWLWASTFTAVWHFVSIWKHAKILAIVEGQSGGTVRELGQIGAKMEEFCILTFGSGHRKQQAGHG